MIGPLPNKPKMRVINRGDHYTYPFAVQSERRFLCFRWWHTITCRSFYQSAKDHADNYMTVVDESEP